MGDKFSELLVTLGPEDGDADPADDADGDVTVDGDGDNGDDVIPDVDDKTGDTDPAPDGDDPGSDGDGESDPEGDPDPDADPDDGFDIDIDIGADVNEDDSEEVTSLKTQIALMNKQLMNVSDKQRSRENIESMVPDINVDDLKIEVGSKEEFNTLLDSQEVFEKFMTDVVSKTAKIAYKKAVENTLKITPTLLTKEVERAFSQRDIRNAFYKDNSELVGHEAQVSEVAQQIYAKNPKKTPQEIMAKTAEVTRKLLKLKKQALAKVPIGEKPKVNKNKVPAMRVPGKTGTKKKVEKVPNEDTKAMVDFFDSVGRSR